MQLVPLFVLSSFKTDAFVRLALVVSWYLEMSALHHKLDAPQDQQAFAWFVQEYFSGFRQGLFNTIHFSLIIGKAR